MMWTDIYVECVQMADPAPFSGVPSARCTQDMGLAVCRRTQVLIPDPRLLCNDTVSYFMPGKPSYSLFEII